MALAILLLRNKLNTKLRTEAIFGGGSVVVGILFNVPSNVCGGSLLVFVLVCVTLCPF